MADQKKTPEEVTREKRERIRVSYEHILRICCRSTMPHRIAEWGPGDSTIMMVQECPGSHILSVEHSPDWYNKAVERLGKNRQHEKDPHGYLRMTRNDSKITLCEVPISMKGGQSCGYVTTPLYLKNLNAQGVMKDIDKGYQLVFVDGRFRFDCLNVAREMISDDGIVVVHDAQRANYQRAFKAFKHVHYIKEQRTAALSMNVPLDFIETREQIWWDLANEAQTIDELERRFSAGDPFYYIRFGDADLYFVNDPWFNKNRRHQPKTEKFSQELRECLAIDHDEFMIGAAAMAGWGRKSKERELTRIIGKFFHRKKFWSATPMHVTFLNDYDRFKEFLKVFQGRKVDLVGGATVCRSPEVRKAFNIQDTIALTDTNAYDILDKHMPAIEKMARGSDILISALGQTTRIVAKRLWNMGIRNIQYFDVGSIVDALAGVKTRSWIKKHDSIVEERRAEWK